MKKEIYPICPASNCGHQFSAADWYVWCPHCWQKLPIEPLHFLDPGQDPIKDCAAAIGGLWGYELRLSLHPRLTVFVGPNGCGKSDILRSLKAAYPGLVVLDNWGEGLHPKSQKELVKAQRDLYRDRQIVAATHSPYLLDQCYADEVRVLCLDNLGRTQCASLDSHPEHPRWKEEMSAGELWMLWGERWVLSVKEGVQS